MKTPLAIVIAYLTLLTACSNHEGASSYTGAGEDKNSKAPGLVGGSVGTSGGGGTLVSAFRRGALLAHQLLAENPKVAIDDPANDGLNAFYKIYRERWMAALKNFVYVPESVQQTEEALKEDGVSVGALTLSSEASKKVLLSVPYLTGRAGFTEDKQISLAIHESGHVAFEEKLMTPTEHSYLDQIASLLVAKRGARGHLKPTYSLDDQGGWGRTELTSDGKQLLQFPGDYSILVRHLETGFEERFSGNGPFAGHDGRFYLGEDWIALLRGDEDHPSYLFRNLKTNETFSQPVKAWVRNGTVLPGAPIFSLNGDKLEIVQGNLLTTRHLDSGETKEKSLPNVSGWKRFNNSQSLMAVTNGNTAALVTVDKGEILDFARSPKYTYQTTFLDNERILLSPEYEGTHLLINAGKETEMQITAAHFLGWSKDRTQLLFEAPSFRIAKGILAVDPIARKESLIEFPDHRTYAINERSDGNTFLLERDDLSVWMFDLSKPDEIKRLSPEGAKERSILFKVTSAGRVAITLDVSDENHRKLIVRYLD